MATDVLSRMTSAMFRRLFVDGACRFRDLSADGFTDAEIRCWAPLAAKAAKSLAEATERALPRRARREQRP